tara:strand:+ start:1433 stop:1714 length:282 start_codon:yes stop_codon:yes gene_type:complete
MKVSALNEVEFAWLMSKIEEAITTNEDIATKMDNADDDEELRYEFDFAWGGPEWDEYREHTDGRIEGYKYIKWLLEEGISEVRPLDACVCWES